MKKWLIYVLTLLILTTSTIAMELCQNPEEITSPCTMLTPSLICSNYTYSISSLDNITLVVNESLTTFNTAENIYQFNFTFEEGGYIVILCDASTREIQVKQNEIKEELNMIAIVFMYIMMIVGFAWIGIVAKKYAIRNTAIVFAGIEFINMMGTVYVNQAGGSITNLLKINFILMGILGMGLLLIHMMYTYMNFGNFDGEEASLDNDNWTKNKPWK